jgi:hypothetical protein
MYVGRAMQVNTPAAFYCESICGMRSMSFCGAARHNIDKQCSMQRSSSSNIT